MKDGSVQFKKKTDLSNSSESYPGCIGKSHMHLGVIGHFKLFKK